MQEEDNNTTTQEVVIVAKDYGNYVCSLGRFIAFTEDKDFVLYKPNAIKAKTKIVKDNWLVMSLSNYMDIKDKYKCKKDREIEKEE